MNKTTFFIRVTIAGVLMIAVVGCTQYGGKSSTPRRLEGQGAEPADQPSQNEKPPPAP